MSLKLPVLSFNLSALSLRRPDPFLYMSPRGSTSERLTHPSPQIKYFIARLFRDGVSMHKQVKTW